MLNHIQTHIRANGLYKEARQAVVADTHRIFIYLLILQWIAAVSFAAFTSPTAWNGGRWTFHPHFLSAVLLGGAINSVPLYLIRVAPQAALTRHVVVIGQMLWSALLIHISGGRVETHFHVFGSLAFVAFYRDWTLILTATAVTAGDHLFRGTFWPESVYGTSQPAIWRFLEHVGWVAFESIVLVFACSRSQKEMRIAATREATLEELHSRIESEVERKTAELVATTQRNDALESELLQAHKLEAVGRLSSGVAHEINTPVQFVSDSAHFMKTGIDDFTKLSDELAALARASDHVDSQTILAKLDEIDYEYLRERMPKAVDRSIEGLERVAEIVRSMKAFAHPDQKQKALSDINSAIRTTLIVARNEYKYIADISLSLGNLPLVLCHIGELNQVFINMIVNAAHAIEERNKGTEDRGVISISSEVVDRNWVEIMISDTGCGISQENLERVFEPFFTTKEVGRGTGQGLTIAHGVITKKHGGTLSVKSRVGIGTSFCIRLPIEQKAEVAA
ncbi:MAG TPA: ATP-binding protein [Fimbriimonas sp.]|nr:ATP-binding protein [Fimbriimonas sp.]